MEMRVGEIHVSSSMEGHAGSFGYLCPGEAGSHGELWVVALCHPPVGLAFVSLWKL